MSTLTIDADTLKTLRKARKFGRPKLAKLSGLTERQIARIEGAKLSPMPATADMVTRLSIALQIPAEKLTGEDMINEFDLVSASKPSCSCCS